MHSYLNIIPLIAFLDVLAIEHKKAVLEEELLASGDGFGQEYRDYVKKTGRFLPLSCCVRIWGHACACLGGFFLDFFLWVHDGFSVALLFHFVDDGVAVGADVYEFGFSAAEVQHD